MEQSRKRMKFEILIERYFSNFWRVLVTNLLFFIPLSVVFGIYYFVLSIGSTAVTTVVSVLLVTIVFGFYPGVVLACRDIARGDEKVKVLSTFIKGIKENFFKFVLYGFLLSLVTVFSYFSISIYSKMLSSSWLFYAALFICILIVLAVLFIFFYIPVMTVTFDLPIKYVIKNSFLMSFGEIKNNFKALVSLVVVVAFCFTVTAFFTQAYLVVIITLLLLALIVPASCQFVVSFYVYDDMYSTIAQRDSKAQNINDAIVEAKNNKSVLKQEIEDYSDVDLSTLKDTDDFIFYNGKMIKQSQLRKKVLEQRGETQSKPSEKDV